MTTAAANVVTGQTAGSAADCGAFHKLTPVSHGTSSSQHTLNCLQLGEW